MLPLHIFSDRERQHLIPVKKREAPLQTERMLRTAVHTGLPSPIQGLRRLLRVLSSVSAGEDIHLAHLLRELF